WMSPPRKSSRSALALAVPLQKVYKIRVGSASLSIFQRIVSKIFLQQWCPLVEKHRGRRPRLQQRSRRQRRRRVSSCRSSKSRQDPIDDVAQRSPTEGNEDNEEFQIDYSFCFLRCLL